MRDLMIFLEAGMSSTHIFVIAATAISVILGGLKLPDLYKFFATKADNNMACKEEIQALQLRLTQITTGVNILISGIEDEFEDNLSLSKILDQVKIIINTHADGTTK